MAWPRAAALARCQNLHGGFRRGLSEALELQGNLARVAVARVLKQEGEGAACGQRASYACARGPGKEGAQATKFGLHAFHCSQWEVLVEAPTDTKADGPSSPVLSGKQHFEGNL